MDAAIWTLSLVLLAHLLREAHTVRRARGGLRHVVHVNGTRGKSTTSRLIEAGLRAGGWRVFCKTTGTDPMTIDVAGVEAPLPRRGKPNIKEQIGILRRAHQQGAQVLVVECMAVLPELQRAAQHDILRADVGVITNIRRDHTDVMGQTPEEICDALAGTIPRGGVLVTGETRMAQRLSDHCARLNCRLLQALPDGSEPELDFPENVAVALAVCETLGVSRDRAMEGMAHYRRDPYALSLHRVGADLVAGALSVNDVESTLLVYQRIKSRPEAAGLPLILLVNNRADRGSRTQEMLALCRTLQPEAVWLLGAAQGYMSRRLKRTLPGVEIRRLDSARDVAFSPEAGRLIFAVGNIAQEGKNLMARVREEGWQLV